MNNFNESGGGMRSDLSTSSLSLANSPANTWIVLDVGGKEFKMMKRSLGREPGSFLAKIQDESVDPYEVEAETEGFISKDENGRWKIDGNSDYFDYVAKYLRTGKFNDVRPGHSLQDLMDEAELYKLAGLVDICQQRIGQQQQRMGGTPTPSLSSSSSTMFLPVHGQGQVHLHQQQQFIQQRFSPMAPPPGFESAISSPNSQHQFHSMSNLAFASDFGTGGTNSHNNSGGIPAFQQPPAFPARPQMPMPTNVVPTMPPTPLSAAAPFDLERELIDETLLSQFAEPSPTPIGVSSTPDGGLSSRSGNGPRVRDMWEEEDDEEEEEEYQPREEGEISYEDEEDATLNDMANDNGAEDEENGYEDGEQQRRFDVASSVFMPPANYCPLVDLAPASGEDGQQGPRAQVPAFELSEDGTTVINYGQVIGRRRRCVEEFLKCLLKQNRGLITDHFRAFGHNMGNVCFYLQRLYIRHPDGCPIKEYCDFENSMKMSRRTQQAESIFHVVPAVPSLLQSPDHLLSMDTAGRLHVSEEIRKVHLLCLRQNLCSNLFRFLKKAVKVQVPVVLEEMQKMVPASAPKPGPRCLLSIANRYPLVFELFFNQSRENNYSFETGWMCLNAALVKNEDLNWRLVFDTDVSNVGEYFCDCGHCCC